MRKLASFGQAIVCTIHQPSATLFDAFDVLLLLARGGRTTYFGPTGQFSATVIDYFARNGVPCPEDSNPAEHIVDVVQGRFGTEIDWPQVWLDSPERSNAMAELDLINSEVDDESLEKIPTSDIANAAPEKDTSFATPIWYQMKIVTRRQVIALWRNPDYIWNKIGLHVTNGLFGGFTFWMVGNGTFDLQLRLMAMLNFIFVAPGCINQMQPLFIQNRDIFETREKKSKTYHWAAFVMGQIVSETPALILCGTLAFVTWYFTVGFPVKASISGQLYFQMLSKYSLHALTRDVISNTKQCTNSSTHPSGKPSPRTARTPSSPPLPTPSFSGQPSSTSAASLCLTNSCKLSGATGCTGWIHSPTLCKGY